MKDKQFIEEVFAIAFGDDAINRGYTQEIVLERLKHISDFEYTFGNGEPIEELENE